LDYTLQKAIAERDAAKTCLQNLPDTPAKTALSALADIAVARRS
jgi:geranylgeranyl pyrophosphate synthase